MHVPFEFGELRFSKKELIELEKPVFSFIVGSSIASNDVVILQRLAILHAPERSTSEVINAYKTINYLVIIRILAGKVYEYIRFVEGFVRNLKRNQNSKLNEFVMLAENFLLAKNDPEFSAARDLRDNITHHYHGAADLKNLSAFAEGHEFSLFLHETTGNSISPLGEDIGTFGLLNSRSDKIALDSLVDWIIKTSGQISSFQQQTLILIIERFFPQKKLNMRKVPVESHLVGVHEDAAPIFFTLNKQE